MTYCKLKQNDGSGELPHISDFGSISKQRVVLNGQSSSKTKVHVGVPQGSVIRPLLYK